MASSAARREAAERQGWTAADHVVAAELLLAQGLAPDHPAAGVALARAQVHATLALAISTASELELKALVARQMQADLAPADTG